ncbi:discoidin domain-containing protein [Kitasatospora sp. NPDC001664]
MPASPVRPPALALLLAVTLTAAALLFLPSARAQAAPVLLSQGRPVTASSTEHYGTVPGNAVDGDAGTRWSSAAADPQWLQVDLGAVRTVGQVVIRWETAYAKAYRIELSADATSWTTAYSTTTGPGGVETLAVSGQGRYVRLYGTQRATQYGYSLWEFQVYGSDGGTPTPSPTPSPTPTPTPTSTPTQEPGWSTVFADTFDGAAGTRPAAADWTVQTGRSYPGGPAGWGTGEVQTATDAAANVGLDGAGRLALTARRDGAGAWTSGRVESRRSDFAAPAGGKLMITVNARQPDAADATGYWPSVRVMGAGNRDGLNTWPGAGELDLLEAVNGHDRLGATLHCGSNPGGVCNEPNGLTSGLASCPGCRSAVHEYAVVLDRSTADEQVRWYLDGRQVWQVNESQVGVAAWDRAVHRGFYLVLNLGIGGGYPDAVCGCTTPTAATTPGGTLAVDSVTVRKAEGPASAPMTDPAVPSGRSVVKVTGSQGSWGLSVNGAPYQVKGVTWGPAAADAVAYVRELKAAGVNTVRTWGTDAGSRPLLDAAAAHGLKVVAGFWLNQGADYVNDTAYKNATLDSVRQWVTTYKDHPGVLMWDLGNEVILTAQDHTYNGTTVEQQRVAYAQFVEQLARAVHAVDPDHPVTSTDAYTGAWAYYRDHTPSLDLLAVNAYGSVCNVRQDWLNGGYAKPYIVTETGPRGEWEVPNDANGAPTEPTDVEKRDGYTRAWGCITGHPGVALGATMFNYGQEYDFAGVWYNLTPNRWKRLGFHALAAAYGGSAAQGNTPPVISALTADATVAAGGKLTLRATVTDPDADLIRYQVLYGTRTLDGGGGLRQAEWTEGGDGTFTVTAPRTLGVWKVYLQAHDGHGNVGIETRTVRVVPGSAPGTDLSTGRPATASSYQANGNGAPYPPANATDGNWSTRWASEWSDPQWLQVDLGRVATVRHVRLGWESAYAKAYQVQFSSDGTQWTTGYATTTGTGGLEDLDVSGSGRYVRVLMTQRGTAYGYSLHEFGVYA